MQHGYREVGILVRVKTETPWHEVERAVAEAKKALHGVADGIEVTATPEAYRQPIPKAA